MDGWNTSFLLGWPIFTGYVSFREGKSFFLSNDFNFRLLFLCLVQLPNSKPCPAGGMCAFDGLRPFAAWRGGEGADDPMARGTWRRISS